MVSLSIITTSNSLISSTFSRGLVALFVGATSGIGEITLKKFAKYSHKPRAYLIGRSQDAADHIVAECKTLNPEGEYTFIKADVSLIRVVDDVCEQIKAKEKYLNILFLSQGVMSLNREVTSENLHLLAALNYYSRLRFITNLLPLLQQAPSIRRVISVAGGTQEGPLDPTDFQAFHVPLPEFKGHLSTLITLGLEAVTKTALEVSYIYDYPGTVKTKLLDNVPEDQLKMYEFVPIEECGERHLYLATSARFSPAGVGNAGVRLGDGDEVALGTTGGRGTGVYSVGLDCEGASSEAWKLLADLREKGMVDQVWRHTEEEFRRIADLEGGI